MEYITEYDRLIALEICHGDKAKADNLLRLWGEDRQEYELEAAGYVPAETHAEDDYLDTTAQPN